MKELTIEEKAKAYDEAIKYAYYLINERCKKGTDGSFHRADLQKMFPELAESDDEKISKEIIDIINSYDVYHLKVAGLPSRIPEYIAWLEAQCEYANFRNKIQIGDKVTRNEDGVLVNLSQLKRVAKKDDKQGEQKPAWSEEDEKMIDAIYSCVDSHYDGLAKDALLIWLKSLKDRIQPKQEWSEEDKNRINRLIAYFEDKESFTAEDDIVYANWLKSLRPQNRWMPSAFHLECIEDAISLYETRSINAIGLKEILDELKKLKG